MVLNFRAYMEALAAGGVRDSRAVYVASETIATEISRLLALADVTHSLVWDTMDRWHVETPDGVLLCTLDSLWAPGWYFVPTYQHPSEKGWICEVLPEAEGVRLDVDLLTPPSAVVAEVLRRIRT